MDGSFIMYKILPPNTTIFSGTKYKDNKSYCFEFLAKDWSDAIRICELLDLSTGTKDLGTLEMVLDETPDGPMIVWDNNVAETVANLRLEIEQLKSRLRIYE